MIRITSGCMRASIALTALVAGTILLSGCGDSSSTDTAAQPGPAPAAPAVPTTPQSKPMTFDKLTLESKVARATEPNGPTYLSFSYADRDGSIYKCRMPEAMSKGEFTPEDWTRRFNIYRVRTVGKKQPKKVIKDANNDGLNDFPFIAPRPSKAVAPQSGPAPSAAPMAPPSGSGSAPMPRGPSGP